MLADGQVSTQGGGVHLRARSHVHVCMPLLRARARRGPGHLGARARTRRAADPGNRYAIITLPQLTLGDKVLKHNGRKIRRLALGALGGFAGAQRSAAPRNAGGGGAAQRRRRRRGAAAGRRAHRSAARRARGAVAGCLALGACHGTRRGGRRGGRAAMVFAGRGAPLAPPADTPVSRPLPLPRQHRRRPDAV